MVRRPPAKTKREKRHWLVRRARLLSAGLAGLAAGLAFKTLDVSFPAAALVGWNAGAVLYVILSWRLFLTAGEAEVRQRAAEEDEARWAVLGVVVAAVIASLAAIVMMLMGARTGSGPERAAAPVLAVLTLVVSWTMLQTIFVLHYAHRHFSDDEGSRTAGGFGFPGEAARTYRDFVYLSFCIGATFQVSDTEVRRPTLRNLVAAHSAVAYFYNTAILALGINIVAGLIGR